MTAESLFSAASFLVLPGWLLLVFLPRWSWTQRVAAVVVPLTLGAMYLALIATNFGKNQGGGFGSLAQISQLFQNPFLLLAGWIHYLAFDLFIGAWEVRDAGRLRISQALVVPCLVLTFLFGPIGLLTWFVIRSSVRGLAEVK
jgi:hypothetical protein